MASCEWRERLEIGATPRIGLPGPHQEDGWAAPGVNFAGPGWRGEYRMRPTSLFDLAAKIHDLAFVLNDLEIEFDLDERPQPSLSLKAKADAIFRIMTDFSRGIESGPDPAAFLYRNLAGTFFDGDDPSVFRAGDGFRNPLIEPQTRAYLDDPARSLTIPYSMIPRGQRPTRELRLPPHRGESRTEQVANYMQEVEIDRRPGFLSWFRQVYAPVYGQIMSIGAGAGSGGC